MRTDLCYEAWRFPESWKTCELRLSYSIAAVKKFLMDLYYLALLPETNMEPLSFAARIRFAKNAGPRVYKCKDDAKR